MLGVVGMEEGEMVGFEVIEVSGGEEGKGGFGEGGVLGGKGEIKGCFVVLDIGWVDYWLIDLFIGLND